MAKYKYHTVHKTVLGDIHTPVSTYLKLRDLFPQSALMESSDYHGSENNRSFIGLKPIAHVEVSHGTASLVYPDGTCERHAIDADYTCARAVSDFIASFEVTGEASNYCGLYGYTSFNAVRYLENIAVKDSTESVNDAPDILYILYKYIIVFNGYKSEMMLLEMVPDGESDRLDRVEAAIHNPRMPIYDFHPVGETSSTLTDEQHKANVRACIAHCLRGDTFQVVPSRRFVQNFYGDDFKLYRALRSINPSPYLFYFDFGGFRIFGSSPETHCRIEGGRAYIDPIAGTTKRTGNPEQDARNAEYLRNDPKENAEHVMLVDLARNDLSRNCHDVKVDFYKDMQFYSHV
ncbi:MAG: chorismate-binding protein, partial [Bacteroidales bacterium]|nr:chorismate-binding protein [Bacteroidales bacterium]